MGGNENTFHYDPKELKLMLIEGYVCATAILLAFLVIFGSYRRCSSSGFLNLLLWTAYVLSFLLISYTMGQMQSANFRNELFAVWAVFLLVVHGSADSISAYSLNDIEQRRRLYVECVAQLVWMCWLIVMYVRDSKFRVPICLLTVLTIIKASEKFTAYAQASRYGLFGTAKTIADFMGYEHELLSEHCTSWGDIDPKTMKGYNYLVRGEPSGRNPAQVKGFISLVTRKDEKVFRGKSKRLDVADRNLVTIEKIWHCPGKLLNETEDPNGRLKDICLSFALFKLIRRRFAGYTLLESSKEKTWRFVRYGLASGEDDYERPFKIIEVELSFLYDFFYTKYSFLYESGMGKYLKAIQIVIVCISSWVAVVILLDYKTPQNQLSIIAGGQNVDVLVTGIAIVAIVIAEFIQLFFLMLSDWTKVLLVYMYVRRPSWQASWFIGKVLQIVCYCRRPWLRPWQRKIGQYSLLNSVDFSTSKSVLLIFTLTAFVFDRGVNVMKEIRIKLPTQVKRAVIRSLSTIEQGERLSNGKKSLSRNGRLDGLSKYCELETTTHVIMVWHIATSFCEFAPHPADSDPGRDDFIVATSLSKYCAYLVVFAPRLLPDHAFVTECTFVELVNDAKHLLDGCKTTKERYKEMMKLAENGDQTEETVTKMGARLGKQLIEEITSQEERWRVLAEFWAELMLFVAPTDNATVHAEFLAKGGEFVTHLWALLSHAGIINQHSTVPSPEEPAGKISPSAPSDV